MQTTRTPEETDPHDIFVIEPDVVLAARADRPLAEQPSLDKTSPDKAPANLAEDIMGDILSRPSTPKLRVVPDISVAAPLPPVDTKFRATAATADVIANDIKAPGEIKVPGDIHLNGAQPSRGAWLKRASFAFLFALASVAAAEGWDRYGDTARQMLAQWTPALTLPSSQPAATAAAVPANPPTVQTAAAVDQTPASPASAAAQPAAAQPAPDAAAATLPSAQALQSMTRDLADMSQQIEALKASIAQLKAGQEQMAQQIQRDMVKNAVARTETRPVEARTAEHPRVLGTPPRPLQAPLRKPPQAAYAPLPPTAAAMNVPPPYPSRPSPVAAPAPMQALPPVESEAPDGGPVVRPPMPLH